MTIRQAAALALVSVLAVLSTPALWHLPIAVLTVAAALGVQRLARPAAEELTPRAQRAVDAGLARLIEPMAEGVVLLDAERTVVAANPAAARIVGQPLTSMAGRSLMTALRDHSLAEVARVASGEATPAHLSLAGRDVLATATAVQSGAVRTLLLIEDVTELERARRARADLVANMSHELRTPVAAALALAETLRDGVDEPADRAYFQGRLVEEVERLSTMVERLLRLSRIESGSEPLDFVPLAPAALIAEAIGRVDPIASQREVTLASDVPDLPEVRGDHARTLEVLSNLLDNALRHSPDGGRVLVAASAQDDGLVRFEVTDEGPGILPSDRERVFERFYTGNPDRRPGGGTGLGLSIARHIVERSGGRIWVADRAPGATLCFTLPAADQAATSAGTPLR